MRKIYLSKERQTRKQYKTLKEARAAAKATKDPYIIPTRAYDLYHKIFLGYYVLANHSETEEEKY